MTRRAKVWMMALVMGAVLASAGCYGSGTTVVGVYGSPVYGPGAWGGYPYPGMYPPRGGGVWIGAPRCCYEEEQDALDGAKEEDAQEDQNVREEGDPPY